MTTRIIRLPNGKPCRLGAYVKAWQTLKTLPADALVPGFDHFPQPAADILRALRSGVQDRINRHDRTAPTGRKTSERYQIGLQRDARNLHAWRTARIRFYAFDTPELQRRFKHLMPNTWSI